MFTDYGLKEPEFKIISGGLSVTVYKDEDSNTVRNNDDNVTDNNAEKVGEKVGEKITKNQQLMLDCIIAAPNATAADMALAVGISKRKVEENLSKLKTKGIIKRVGPDKSGYWKIEKL